MIIPDWPAPARVRALVTTRDFGDVSLDETRRRLRALTPAEPSWLRQVHGKQVIQLDSNRGREADASVARDVRSVCVVQMADCMPVLFADDAGTVVAAAHAGWRGLVGGVLEATMEAMRVPRANLHAWLGPAIGPGAYEVGEDVRMAFSNFPFALKPGRPGRWLLDLYAVAREKLKGLKSVSGGAFCTYSEPQRFFSYRRDRTKERMAALIWLA